jgi:hypothetical protein
MRGVHQSLEVQSHASAGLFFFFRVGILRRCEQAGPRRRPPTTHTTSTSAAGRASTAPRTPAADKQHYRRHDALTPRDVFGVAGELLHFGDAGSLKGLTVGVALGWAVAPGISATGVQDHEGPRA